LAASFARKTKLMPPRKRNAEKTKLGTLRPSRVREQPERPAEDIGAPDPDPAWPPLLRKNYLRLKRDAERERLVTKSHGPVLLLGAQAFTDFDTLRQFIEQHGLTYLKDGMIRPRPEVALYDQAWKRCLLALRALALSPSSRGQVEPLTDPEPVDPMEKLLRAREAGP
jgi:hypothetical protein